MAAPIEESFDEKLISFRQLLHDTDTDNDMCAYFYTEYNTSVIRDVTLCIQVTENRHVDATCLLANHRLRSRANLFPGTFVPSNFRSSGQNGPGNFRAMLVHELDLPFFCNM